MKKNYLKSLLIFSILLLTLVCQSTVFGKSDKSNNAGSKEDKPNNNVVVGNVDKVNGNSIQINEKNDKNNKVEAKIDRETKIVGQDKKTLKLEQIKSKDKVAVFGTKDKDNKIQKVTKLMVKQATSSATTSAQISKRQAIQGVITNISGSIITVAHQIHRDRIFQVLIDSQTQIKDPKVATGSAKLQVGQRIAAVGENKGNNSILARLIHIIPGKATGVFKKNPLSTNSGTPVSSTSATPTSTSSATPTGLD